MTKHSELDDDEREQIRDRLKQERMIESAFTNGDGPWTIVYDDWRFDNNDNGGRYMAFAQPRTRSFRTLVGIRQRETATLDLEPVPTTQSTIEVVTHQNLNRS